MKWSGVKPNLSNSYNAEEGQIAGPKPLGGYPTKDRDWPAKYFAGGVSSKNGSEMAVVKFYYPPLPFEHLHNSLIMKVVGRAGFEPA